MSTPTSLPSGRPWGKPDPEGYGYGRATIAATIPHADWRDGRAVGWSATTAVAPPPAHDLLGLRRALTGSKAGNPDRTMLRDFIRGSGAIPNMSRLASAIARARYPSPRTFAEAIVASCPYLTASRTMAGPGVLHCKPTSSGLLGIMQVETMVAYLWTWMGSGHDSTPAGPMGSFLNRIVLAAADPVAAGVKSGASKTGYRSLLSKGDAIEIGACVRDVLSRGGVVHRHPDEAIGGAKVKPVRRVASAGDSDKEAGQ